MNILEIYWIISAIESCKEMKLIELSCVLESCAKGTNNNKYARACEIISYVPHHLEHIIDVELHVYGDDHTIGLSGQFVHFFDGQSVDFIVHVQASDVLKNIYVRRGSSVDSKEQCED